MATSVFNTPDFRPTVAEVCDPGMYGANVRLTLRNGAIELMATDGIAGIRRRVEGAVAQEVAVHLPAAVLRSVVEALPANETQLEFGQSAKIFSGSASFELSVLAEELPDWEEGTPSLSLDGPQLAQGLRAVEYAARGSHNAFSGICFDLDGETLTLAATDNRRLALYRLNGVRHEPLQRTIRLQDARKLSRIAKRGGSVALSFEESRVLAATDRTSFVCRVLDGRFPDYRRVIPSAFPTQARDNVQGPARARPWTYGLQDVVVLVFHLPTRTSPGNNVSDILGGDGEVGDKAVAREQLFGIFTVDAKLAPVDD